MRVLHVSSPLSWRGGEQQVAYLAGALNGGTEKQWILTPEGSELYRRIPLPPEQKCKFRTNGFLNLNLAAEIARCSRKLSIDIVHTHDSHSHSAAVIAATFFGLDCPLVISRRVDFPVSTNPFSRWKYNHPAVRRIICVSDEIKRITAPAIRNKTVLQVIHSGIDLSRYEGEIRKPTLKDELGLEQHSILVGNLSALADHKDFPTWLKAARILARRHPQLYFIIAGKGPEEDTIRRFITENSLEEHIRLIGFRNDIPSVMRSLDIFLMSSKTEGLGTILIEAMAAGVPVVATRAGGIPELVEDGVTGLLAVPGDSEGLADAVTRLLEDAVLRQKIKNNARMKAGEFSFRKTAEATLAVYRQIISC